MALTKDVIAAAQASQKKWGVPASISLAQFAVESAWGTRMPAGSNNPFGIKAVAGQPSVLARTREVKNGQSYYINAPFRKFKNFIEAFDLHGALLHNGRPYVLHHLMDYAKDPNGFAQCLQRSGYATDPHYANALIAIMHGSNLYQYDKAA